MLVAEKKITVSEFLQMEFEGEDAYYELINGQIVKKAAPTTLHQEISILLSSKMLNHALQNNLGKVLTAPTDVFLDRYNHFLPDVFFVRKDNLGIIDYKEGSHGILDLIVEIISPGSILIDREDKKVVYQNLGVREYWLVDPNNRSVEIYENKAGRFEPVSFAVDAGKVQSVVLAGFEVEISEIFPASQ